TRLTAWLKSRDCRNSASVAQAAVEAAAAQHTSLPTQSVGCALVAKLAAAISAVNDDRCGTRRG
ncbi:IS110 family transposase, partial [Kocuria sp. NPDC057446]